MTQQGNGPEYLGDQGVEVKPGSDGLTSEARALTPTGGPLILSGMKVPTTAEITEGVKEQIRIRDAYVAAVMNALKPKRGDVVDYGGNPYFRGFGADRIRGAARVSIVGVRMEGPLWSQDARGSFYLFRCYGTLTHPWLGDVEAVGTCTSRAQFFAKRTQWVDDPDKPGKQKKVPYYLPAEDVAMGNIERNAYTEMARKGLESLLGTKGITWDELLQYGIKQADCVKVSFKKGGQSRGESESRRSRPADRSGKGGGKPSEGKPSDESGKAGTGGDKPTGGSGQSGGSPGPGTQTPSGSGGTPVGPGGEIDFRALADEQDRKS